MKLIDDLLEGSDVSIDSTLTLDKLNETLREFGQSMESTMAKSLQVNAAFARLVPDPMNIKHRFEFRQPDRMYDLCTVGMDVSPSPPVIKLAAATHQRVLGMDVIETVHLTVQVPRRTHRKKRIRKKWLKRYGTRPVPDANVYMLDGKVVAHPDVIAAMMRDVFRECERRAGEMEVR